MGFSFFSIFVLVFIAVVAVITIAGATFVFIHVFKTFRRVGEVQADIMNAGKRDRESHDNRKLNTAAGDVLRCRQCGAVIDSTAELSPEGSIRCNYCNSWTNLYSPGGDS